MSAPNDSLAVPVRHYADAAAASVLRSDLPWALAYRGPDGIVRYASRLSPQEASDLLALAHGAAELRADDLERAAQDGEDWCDVSRGGLICTRLAGHSGRHVAHDEEDRPAGQWPTGGAKRAAQASPETGGAE